MYVSPQNPVPESHPVDAVFALLSDDRVGPRMPSEHGSIEIKPLQPSGPPPLDPPALPPDTTENQDLRAAYEWLQTERARLEMYTRAQFEKVQQQHQELMTLHFQREQEAALQVQDINREIQRLATYSESIDERAAKLDEREQDLSGQEEKLAGLRKEVRTFQQTQQTLQQEITVQRALVDDLEAGVAQLRAQEQDARAAREHWEAKHAESRRTWEQKEAELAAGAGQLDARARELDERAAALVKQRTELAKAAEEVVAIVQKRKALEKDIQTQLILIEELRGRTSRLRTQAETAQKELEVCQTRVNESRQTWEKKETELGERYAHLEQRYQALERSEEAIKRRMAELEETEHRVETEYERQEKQLAMDCQEIDRLRAILREHGLDPANSAKGTNSIRVKQKAIRVE